MIVKQNRKGWSLDSGLRWSICSGKGWSDYSGLGVVILLRSQVVILTVFPTPTSSRINKDYRDILNGQYIALEIWKKELKKRFSVKQLLLPITEIELKKYK